MKKSRFTEEQVLTIQRLVIDELVDRHMGKKSRLRNLLVDRLCEMRRGVQRVAMSAAVLADPNTV